MTAFLIVAHEEPTVFGRLIRRLAGYPTYVHVDGRRSSEPFLSAARGQDHVHFIAVRRRVHWGGFSVVESALDLMQVAVSASNGQGHLVLLSGTCYPLRPVPTIAAELAAHPQTDFIRLVDARWNPHVLEQLSTRHYRDRISLPARFPAGAQRQLLHLVEAITPRRRRQLPDLRFAYGHAHWALTRQTAQMVLSARCPELDQVFKYAASPDETYVHSVIANSERLSHTIDGGMARDRCGCVRRLSATHELRAGLEGWWQPQDLPLLLSGGAWFARKFGGPQASRMLDALDEVVVGA